MSKMKEMAKKVLFPVATAVGGFVASPFARKCWVAASNLVAKFSKEEILSLVGILLLGCIGLASALYQATSRSRLLSRYDFDESSGLRRHKKTGKVVCPQCLQKDGVEAALKREASAWRCEIHPTYHYYSDPDNVQTRLPNTTSGGM
jgi:hypothetical protein